MLKTGIENLKDGMKVVVEDMDKVLHGSVVGESGQVLIITRNCAGSDGWRLLNPDTGMYMYISPDEYQYVTVIEELANCESMLEKYPEGTRLKCLSDDLDWYTKGVIYEVGYCETVISDYGVVDQDGDVMMEAIIYRFGEDKVGGFDPDDWEVVEEKTKEPNPEPKFKVGDIVVRARDVGRMKTAYPVGTVMEVTSNPSVINTYWCKGHTPHSIAEGQFVSEEDLELASIEDIKKLTKEFTKQEERARLETIVEYTEELKRRSLTLDSLVSRMIWELENK